MLLNVRPGTLPAEARAALAETWDVLSDLRRGVVRDLLPTRPDDPQPTLAPAGLTCLLGFGARLFDERAHAPALVRRELRPWELSALRPSGPGAPFPKLPWAPEGERRPGEADICLQFVAEREIAINRAAVELWKLTADRRLPLEVVAFHRGFQRDDGRSWIDFHDGVNNLRAEERREAIQVTSADPAWLTGGTFLASLRIRIDLPAWRALPREHQELVVGREKLTGCPLRSSTDGAPRPLEPCPLPDPATEEQLAAYTNPGRDGGRVVEASHIHRANLNRGAPDTDANNRIFRQGFEFLDVLDAGRVELGLHFVSFQRSLGRVRAILQLQGWMGDSNFGGTEPPRAGEPAIDLMKLVAGGFYAVPPRGEPFPGAELI